jgi:hypothetical protein
VDEAPTVVSTRRGWPGSTLPPVPRAQCRVSASAAALQLLARSQLEAGHFSLAALRLIAELTATGANTQAQLLRILDDLEVIYRLSQCDESGSHPQGSGIHGQRTRRYPFVRDMPKPDESDGFGLGAQSTRMR